MMPFLLMILFIGIFAVTAIGGRAWCGWACPQTIFRVIYRDLIIQALEKKLNGEDEKEVDEYFKIYGKVFNFIRSKLHNKFSILRMMPDLLSIFRYMKKNEERFGMEINMRDLLKVAKA